MTHVVAQESRLPSSVRLEGSGTAYGGLFFRVRKRLSEVRR